MLSNGNEQPPIDRLAQELEHEIRGKEPIQEEEEDWRRTKLQKTFANETTSEESDESDGNKESHKENGKNFTSSDNDENDFENDVSAQANILAAVANKAQQRTQITNTSEGQSEYSIWKNLQIIFLSKK